MLLVIVRIEHSSFEHKVKTLIFQKVNNWLTLKSKYTIGITYQYYLYQDSHENKQFLNTKTLNKYE